MEIFHRHHRGEANLDPAHATFTMPFSKILGYKKERMHFHTPGAQRSREFRFQNQFVLSPRHIPYPGAIRKNSPS